MPRRNRTSRNRTSRNLYNTMRRKKKVKTKIKRIKRGGGYKKKMKELYTWLDSNGGYEGELRLPGDADGDLMDYSSFLEEFGNELGKAIWAVAYKLKVDSEELATKLARDGAVAVGKEIQELVTKQRKEIQEAQELSREYTLDQD